MNIQFAKYICPTHTIMMLGWYFGIEDFEFHSRDDMIVGGWISKEHAQVNGCADSGDCAGCDYPVD
jgi:hypothetical protein